MVFVVAVTIQVMAAVMSGVMNPANGDISMPESGHAL
jgi:hypothetical protein